MVTWEVNVNALIPLLSILTYVVPVALALRHRHRRERRAFTLYLIAAGTYSFFSFFVLLENSFLQQYTVTGVKILILAVIWMAVTHYHFVRVFVQKPAGLGVYLGIGLFLLIAVLAALDLVPRDASSVGGKLYISQGPAIYLIATFTLSLVGASFYFLLQHQRRTTSSLARTRTSYLLMGLVVVTLASTTNVISTLGEYPFGNVGNLCNALLISYAILKYQLLDIRFILRRGLAYVALSLVLVTGYILALYLIVEVSSLTLQGSVILAGALAVHLPLGGVSLRDTAQRQVDWLFYRNTYAYREMLMGFSRRAADILSLEELSREMVHVIVNALRASWGALLSPDAVSWDFQTEYVEHLDSNRGPLEVKLRQDNPLVAYLVEEGQVLRGEMIGVVPHGKGLWEAEREELRSLEASLLCPILARGNLTGIVVLGPKERGRPYTDEEADLLLTMVSGAAVAMENARMLESLRQRERAHDELLSRVVSAQEEERQRIAADLHDGVAQWLIWASYQAQVTSALASDTQSSGLREELKEVEDTIDSSVKELRRVLSGLRPPALEELGLPHALKKEVDSLQSEGIKGTFEVQGETVRLFPTVEIATYRLVQESLTNVRKHSRASSVEVQLFFGQDCLRIQVMDNGVGFNVFQTLKSAVSVGHMGLLGMRQRAESLGGELQVESREGSGTRVLLQVPLSAGE